jgi:D-alanyl-D-alanine carboxypeptidase/D-alanyl-D-alanine-endopeptidase (penicillin-binding protein 4)
VPDPNLYAARALAAALLARGVAVEGGAASTTDSLAYRTARLGTPLAERLGRPVDDIIFPILSESQNTFAEYLLKILGREIDGAGSWEAGIAVERRFLRDAVGLDSTAFALVDGSGLATANLVTPRALVRLLDYVARHPRGAAFLGALARPGGPGTLLRRFLGTRVATRLAAKTGSVTHVNSLSGYVERGAGRRLTFAILANSHVATAEQILPLIDALVVEIAK